MWCRDLQAAASRCGRSGTAAVQSGASPTTRSLPCDLCLDVAARQQQAGTPEATETRVLAAVMKTCEWLPSQESSVKCKGMVDAHYSAVLSMLGGDLGSTPGQVCTALTLCQPLQRHPATPRPLSEEDIYDVVAFRGQWPPSAPAVSRFPWALCARTVSGWSPGSGCPAGPTCPAWHR